MIETTMPLSDNPTNVESKDTALFDNDSTEVSTVLFSVSAEMSTTNENQLYSHTRAEGSDSVCDESSVIFSLSQAEASDEYRQKSLSSAVDDAMYAGSIVDDDNVDRTEDDSFISSSSSIAGVGEITDDHEGIQRRGELKTMQLVSLRYFTVL